MPADGAYILDAKVKRVCAGCRQANEDWAAEANTRLRQRFREDCRQWLLNAPLIDPADEPYVQDTLSLKAAVTACFDAFFWIRGGARFDTLGPARHLPGTYRRVLTRAQSDDLGTLDYKGSFYRTPDQRIYIAWDLDEDSYSRHD